MAVDKVKPLKIESSSTGGTQNDMIPVECNPLQDYLAGLGIALQGLDTILIDSIDGLNLRFLDTLIPGGITLSQLRYAKGLNDATGNVDVSASPAPAVGYVLTATSSTLATWQAPITATDGSFYNVANVTITTTDSQITSMTTGALAAGKYLIMFDADFNSATSGIVITYKFRVGGVDGTQKKIMPFAGGTLTAGNQRSYGGLKDIVTVTASQVIQVFASTSSGTVTAANNVLTYTRIA